MFGCALLPQSRRRPDIIYDTTILTRAVIVHIQYIAAGIPEHPQSIVQQTRLNAFLVHSFPHPFPLHKLIHPKKTPVLQPLTLKTAAKELTRQPHQLNLSYHNLIHLLNKIRSFLTLRNTVYTFM